MRSMRATAKLLTEMGLRDAEIQGELRASKLIRILAAKGVASSATIRAIADAATDDVDATTGKKALAGMKGYLYQLRNYASKFAEAEAASKWDYPSKTSDIW